MDGAEFNILFSGWIVFVVSLIFQMASSKKAIVPLVVVLIVPLALWGFTIWLTVGLSQETDHYGRLLYNTYYGAKNNYVGWFSHAAGVLGLILTYRKVDKLRCEHAIGVIPKIEQSNMKQSKEDTVVKCPFCQETLKRYGICDNCGNTVDKWVLLKAHQMGGRLRKSGKS